MTDAADLVRLDVSLLADAWSIPAADIWGVGAIDRRDVLDAIASERFMPDAWTASRAEWTRDMHVARIAYLAATGWRDPIEVDVGIPCLGYAPSWPIQDGNHRFLAALFMGDEWVWADAQGETSEIERLAWGGTK